MLVSIGNITFFSVVKRMLMEGGIAHCDAAWPPQVVAKFTHRRNKLSISYL
jgi:hypothetical protein